jgi:hypothetical protein
MKIPSNIIETDKYTIGKEFINTANNKEYQGYYYQIGNRYFIGKNFDPKALELKKINDPSFIYSKVNPTYGKLTNLSPTAFSSPKIIHNPDLSLKDAQGQDFFTYYAKKINYSPILIREINKETYLELQKSNVWQTIALVTTQGDGGIDIREINKAEKEMPGIRAWLLSSGIGPV